VEPAGDLAVAAPERAVVQLLPDGGDHLRVDALEHHDPPRHGVGCCRRTAMHRFVHGVGLPSWQSGAIKSLQGFEHPAVTRRIQASSGRPVV
jgi:hypothetical protein